MIRQEGVAMYVQQAEFFLGTGMSFAKEVMKLGVRQSHAAGDVIFREGDAASHVYVLLDGRVRIIFGESGHVVYIVSRSGEAFGWSSLVGRKDYSATAECLEATTLIAFERNRFQRTLEEDPTNGLVLYKGLAKTLANRLLQTYQMIAGISLSGQTVSSGSGQFSLEESD